jgi:exodeoxyribonuclease VII small subunit
MPTKPTAPATEKPEPLGFEASLKLVELTLGDLESGKLDLDDALKAYEKAVQLLDRCHKLLDSAEQRVEILTGKNPDDSPKLEPFEQPDS